MAEKVYSTSKLINLHSADGSTLLIPKVPLSTVDNNAYTVVEGAIVTKGAGVSLQAAVQAEIAAAIADDVVGNYVPWTDGSNVEIPGTLTVEGATTLAALSAADTDITGTLDVTGAATFGATLDVTGAVNLKDALTVAKAATLQSTLAVTGKATLSDELEVAKAATFSSDVVVQGKLTVAQEYKIDELTTSVRQAEVATQNYVQTYVAGQIAGVPLLSRKIESDAAIIDTDPTEENLNIIYMIPQGADAQTGKDIYDEYMAFEAGEDTEGNTIYKWQLIGNTDIDLSGYYTSAQVDQKLGDLAEEFAGSGLVTKAYVDTQDAATSTSAVAAANGYTDAQIAAALTGLPEGSKLVAYIDAQDDAHLGSASAYTDAEVAKASSYADEAIAEALDGLKVDGKDLKSYIDAQDNATSTAAVTAANGYTDDALANYFDKDYISANYVPWTSDCDIVVSRSLIVNEDAYIPKLFVGDSSTPGQADINGEITVSGNLTMDGYAQFHNNLDVGYGALAVNTSAGEGSTVVTMGDVFVANVYSSTVTMGSMFEADLYNSTVKVYDEWIDGQTTSTGLAAVATEHDIAEVKAYTDEQLANYVTSDTADGLYIKRQEIGQPYSHILFTSQFFSDYIDLSHGYADANHASVYTMEGADAKFAPLDGATLTNVSSITGENAEIVVSRVTATDIEIANEVQLAGIILGRDTEGGAITHITEDMANFVSVDVASNLTVRDSLEVADVVSITSDVIQLDAGEVLFGETAVFNVGEQIVDFGQTMNIDVANSTVKVYDEWQVPSEDGSSTVTSSGLANVATEHDIVKVMSTINALPGVGEGAILYDIIEDEQI